MLKLVTVTYCILLAFLVVGADNGLLSPLMSWLHFVPFRDKACHFVFVGLLSFFISATLSINLKTKRKRSVVLWTICILALLTSIEETSQAFLVHRQFSELDMLANIAGACVFGSFALLIPTTKKRESRVCGL